MRRSFGLLVGLLLAQVFVPASAQWARKEVDGRSMCVRETGEQLVPSYTAKSTVSIFCKALNAFEDWVGLSTADAALVGRNVVLVARSDGTLRFSDPDGEAGATPPTAPVLGQPIVSDATIEIPLATPCTGGTAPYSYAVERAAAEFGSFVEIASGALFDSNGRYANTGLADSATWFYRSRCEDDGTPALFSAYSNTVSGTTPAGSADVTAPTQPGAITISLITSTTATTTIASHSTDAVGPVTYNVILGLGDGAGVAVPGSGIIIASGVTALIFDYVNLTASTEYYSRWCPLDGVPNTGDCNDRVFFDTLSGAPPAGNTIFRETFEGYPIGTAASNANWSRGVTSNANGSNLTIASTSPVLSGSGKYLRSVAIKAGTSVYRTEWSGSPNNPSGDPVTNLGGGDWKATQQYWYGFMQCFDTFNFTDPSTTVHFMQFHEQGPGPHNPLLSVVGNASYLKFFMEVTDDDGNVLSPVLSTNHQGTCTEIILQIQWDSREFDEGTTGLARLWIGDSTTPVYERVNRSVGHNTANGGVLQVPYIKIGGYESSFRWTGTDGHRFEGRIDNYCAMDATGSRAAMHACVNDPD